MRDRCSGGRSDRRCEDDWRREGIAKFRPGRGGVDNDDDDALNWVQVKEDAECVPVI